MTCSKITYNISLNKQESISQVKQQIRDKLIQEKNCHINISYKRHLKTGQTQQIKKYSCRHKKKDRRG